MRRSRFIPVLAVTLALASGGTATASHFITGAPQKAAAAKSCSSSFTRARINGAIKCLRVGEYCAHAYDHRSPRRYAYKHYGFACKRRDARGSYHLTYR